MKKYAGCTPAEYLEKHDWLGPDVVGAHWTYCTDSDVTLLARMACTWRIAPRTARAAARTPRPWRRSWMPGVNVRLGTDNMTEDMLQAMKIGSIVHRGSYGGGVKPPPQVCWTRRPATAPCRSAPRRRSAPSSPARRPTSRS